MVLSSLAKKSSVHRKSQTTLPPLSLNELQKNYYLLRQRKQNKNPHHSSTKIHSSLQTDILIKSPFYDRSKCSNKISCKCEYHKKIRFEVDKKYKQKEQFNFKNSIPRLKTLADQTLPQSILSQKRFNSLTDQTELAAVKDNKYYQNLISNNHELYKQFLKKLNIQKKSNLDCYNHEFEQFLKSHGKWILHDVKKLGLGKRNSSNLKGDHNRFQTAPSLPRNSQVQQNPFDNSQEKYLWMNVQDIRKNGRKKFKKNTLFQFQSDNEEKLLKSLPFMTFLQNMKPHQRSRLEAFIEGACKQIGIDYSELKNKTVDNTNFFKTVCKHLLDEDGNIVEKAQSILRKMSRLPFELYSTIMKQMNLQLATNFDPKTKTFEPKSDRMQQSVCIAFETIEDSLGQIIKYNDESRGKQKLSILGKLKYKFVGRKSASYHTISDSKKKLRFSNTNSSKQRPDSKRSRFAGDKKDNRDSQNDSSAFNQEPESDQYNSDSNDNAQQNSNKQDLSNLGSKQQRKSIKKGFNLQKLKKNNIMKIIDEEIQFDNNKKINMPKKTDSIHEDQYLRERKQSRKRLRDQELNKHMDFIRLMKEKQNQRVSSTMSECQMKKNTARAHYQRHKVFLKKMQVSLKKNETLKEMVINYEDDLFTKKRKVRILRNMIHHEIPDQQSEFCRDMHKYIDIFEKNCQLVIGKNNWGRFKKYGKRKGDSLFENSYLENEGLETPGEMGDLIQLLRSDHILKYYNMSQINFEQEDYFSLIKQIPTFTTQKIKSHTSKKQQALISNTRTYRQSNERSNTLGQTGMQTKINAIQTIVQGYQEQQKQEGDEKQIESRELMGIQQRFNRNMERYQRIFKTQRFMVR